MRSDSTARTLHRRAGHDVAQAPDGRQGALSDDFPWVAARDATFWAVLSVPNATHAGMTVYCAKAGEGGSYEPGAIVDEFFFENRARRARRNARGAYARRRRVMVGGRLKERGVCGMRFSIGYCLI